VPSFCSSWSANMYSQKHFSYQNIIQKLQLINTSSQIHLQWLIFQQQQFHWQSENNLCSCHVIHIYFIKRLCFPVGCFSKFSALIYLSLTSGFAKLGCIASQFRQMLQSSGTISVFWPTRKKMLSLVNLAGHLFICVGLNAYFQIKCFTFLTHDEK